MTGPREDAQFSEVMKMRHGTTGNRNKDKDDDTCERLVHECHIRGEPSQDQAANAPHPEHKAPAIQYKLIEGP